MDSNNFLETGRERLKEGLIDEAISDLENAISSEPNNPHANMLLGVAYCQKKDFQTAVRFLSNAQQIDPNNPIIAFNLGVAHQSLGNNDQARASYQAAIQLDPSYQKARQALEQLEGAQTPSHQKQDFTVEECPKCRTQLARDAVRCPSCGLDMLPFVKRHILKETDISGGTVLTCSACKALVNDPGNESCINCGLNFKTGIRNTPVTQQMTGSLIGNHTYKSSNGFQDWEYAGFWRRFAGLIIDGLIVGVVSLIFLWPLVFSPMLKYTQPLNIQMQHQTQPSFRRSAAPMMNIEKVQYQTPPGIPGNPQTSQNPFLPPGFEQMQNSLNKAQGLSLLLNALYVVLLIGLTGQTLGMRAVGIKCIRPDGELIGIPRALLRFIVAQIFGFLTVFVIGLIGFLWMCWDPRNQTLYDKAADSIVVRTT